MRVPRVLPTVLDQRSGVAMTALLASEEAAGEFVYVRVWIMRSRQAHRKVRQPDVNATLGAVRTAVGNAADSDKPSEVFRGIAGADCGLFEAQ